MTINPETLRFVRQRGPELFPDGVVSGSVLVSNVAFGAAALGCGHMEICDHDDWWFAASESNWLKSNSDRFASVEDLFSKAIEFPELSPNSIRPEIFVGAFAQRIYVELAGNLSCILGKRPNPPLPHQGVVPPWCVYVLAFELNADASGLQFKH